jgi:hypothetical protein
MKQKPIQNENREDCQDSYALTVSVIAGIVDDWSLNAVLRMKAELFELRVQVIRLQLNDDPTQ